VELAVAIVRSFADLLCPSPVLLAKQDDSRHFRRFYMNCSSAVMCV
jgi:hypothetical protein